MVLEEVEMLKMSTQEIKLVPAPAGSHGSISDTDNSNNIIVTLFGHGKEFLKKYLMLESCCGKCDNKEWKLELLFTKF